jgi:hypothetical protein
VEGLAALLTPQEREPGHPAWPGSRLLLGHTFALSLELAHGVLGRSTWARLDLWPVELSGIHVISFSGRMIRVSTTIEVVGSGMDWAGIAAAGATVVAAVGGIWGTAWQASRARQAASADLRLSIDADDRRTRVAEKRRVYAACLTAANEWSAALRNDRLSRTHDGKKKGNEYNEMLRARNIFVNAISSVTLISPQVGTLATFLFASYLDYVKATDNGARDTDDNGEQSASFQELFDAMYADLSESDPAGNILILASGQHDAKE